MKKRTATELDIQNIEKIKEAIFTNDIKAMKKLIADKVNLNVLITFPPLDNRYSSPLNLTMYNKDISMFKLLLEAGVNPNMHNGWGTDLMYAIQSRKIEHFILLIRYGAKLYIKNRYNQTAITIAKQTGCKEIIDLINSIIEYKRYKKMQMKGN